MIYGSDLAHNTSVREIRVHYPFHPLSGQHIRPFEQRKGPPPTFTVEGANGGRLSIPVWMTEPATEEIRLAPSPFLTIEALLALVDTLAAIRDALEVHQASTDQGDGKQSGHDETSDPTANRNARKHPSAGVARGGPAGGPTTDSEAAPGRRRSRRRGKRGGR